jgi:hypothetical protein
MTDERDTTMDAIKYLREVLRIHAADPAAWVDARTLALALAEFDAARARIAALEAALRALVGPGAVGYHDWFPDQKNRDGCTYCSYEWEADLSERHAPDCPVAAALALLEE